MHTLLIEKFYLCKQNQEGMKEDQKIVIYQTEDGQTQIDVRLENDTVWLTQAQMVELFQTTKQNVSLHLNNLYKEGELEKEGTVKEYLTVQNEGNRKVARKVKFYNLDVIISVGYRVNSKRGVKFRQWTNRVLKEYRFITGCPRVSWLIRCRIEFVVAKTSRQESLPS